MKKYKSSYFVGFYLFGFKLQYTMKNQKSAENFLKAFRLLNGYVSFVK